MYKNNVINSSIVSWPKLSFIGGRKNVIFQNMFQLKICASLFKHLYGTLFASIFYIGAKNAKTVPSNCAIWERI